MTKEQEFRKQTEEAKFEAFSLMCKKVAELEAQISVLLSCKNCPENKDGLICAKEYENKCLAQKIEYIKELQKENAELRNNGFTVSAMTEQQLKVALEKGEQLEKENAELRKVAEFQQSSNMSRHFENKKLKEGLAVGSTFNKALNSMNKNLEEERDKYRNMVFDLQKENAELKDELKNYKNEWQEQVQKATDEGYTRTLQTIQLSKAKELLKRAQSYTENLDDEADKLYDEIEQFLSEVKK